MPSSPPQGRASFWFVQERRGLSRGVPLLKDTPGSPYYPVGPPIIVIGPVVIVVAVIVGVVVVVVVVVLVVVVEVV